LNSKNDVLSQEPLFEEHSGVLFSDAADGNLELTVRHGKHSFTKKFKREIKDLAPYQAFWLQFLQGKTKFPTAIGEKSFGVADLFCASGGLSLGFASAASLLNVPLNYVLGVDIDPRALEVYKYHHKDGETYAGSVEDLVDYQVRDQGENAVFAYPPKLTHIGECAISEPIEIVLAGPPCQGNSTMNVKTRYNDPRNKLYLSAVAFAVAVDAEIVLIENVPGVLKDINGVVFSAISLLRKSGYHINGEILAADKLGWPQTRKRYFLIATKKPKALSLKEIAVIGKRDAANLKWIIGDLEKLSQKDILHSTPALSEENVERITYLQREDLRDLPLHLRPKSHREGTTFTTVYGRLDWEKPSGTITTGFLSPGRGRYIHPTQPRCLSPVEAARIQGFPDDYFPIHDLVPEIRRMELAKWIGDAVPPILGFYAGVVALLSVRIDEHND
jgi:DNA (cytosine-5)-methyltransferase 1